MKKTKHSSTVTAGTAAQRKALASPLRLEILGLFTTGDPLAIADMGLRMGRPAGSLYHHVGVLERAGMLKRAGTRPKGKRFEALYAPVGERIELHMPAGDADAAAETARVMTASLRMTERDLAAALERDDLCQEGPQRNVLALRAHVCASPRLLAAVNKHLRAIEALLADDGARGTAPGPDHQHLSLTLALLPQRGRRAPRPNPKEENR